MITQKKIPYIENAYKESADYGDMLNNNAIIKIKPLILDIVDDSDDDEVFNTNFISTSIASDFDQSLNDIFANEKPNSLVICTDENFTCHDNAVSNFFLSHSSRSLKTSSSTLNALSFIYISLHN